MHIFGKRRTTASGNDTPRYAMRYDRLRDEKFQPQEPSQHDTQSFDEYIAALKKFNGRRDYIDGMHTNPTYTAMAHFWLLKQALPTINEWYFITDRDSSLLTALHRMFVEEIQTGRCHHFLSLGKNSKTRQQAGETYREAFRNLKLRAIEIGDDDFSEENPFKQAQGLLAERLEQASFYDWVETERGKYPVYANRPVLHPLARKDSGSRNVDCVTDLSGYDSDELAKLLLRVNTGAVDGFFSRCRRKINVLERPLTTARQSAKNYMYANINPKYAQQAVTMLRTYLNFCRPMVTIDEDGKVDKRNPAQRLGIAERRYSIKDILYSK